jgi:hypothetical protein
MSYAALLASLGGTLKKPMSLVIAAMTSAGLTWVSQASTPTPSQSVQPAPIIAPIVQTPGCIAHP